MDIEAFIRDTGLLLEIEIASMCIAVWLRIIKEYIVVLENKAQSAERETGRETGRQRGGQRTTETKKNAKK